jgi:hypothetical protein
MTDPFYDRAAALALQLDGVWLDATQSDRPGIHLTSTRDLTVCARELAAVYESVGWRVDDLRFPTPLVPTARMTVLNEIDRQCPVEIAAGKADE